MSRKGETIWLRSNVGTSPALLWRDLETAAIRMLDSLLGPFPYDLGRVAAAAWAAQSVLLTTLVLARELRHWRPSARVQCRTYASLSRRPWLETPALCRT
jgi:hypothetical protein